MPSKTLRSAALLLAGALTLAACGGGDKADEPTTTTEAQTTTSQASTTTTLGDIAPLTGEPQPDAARRQRTTLVVKLDNAPKGRPQAGLNQADIVVSEKVEDGVTRLFAIFQNQDAPLLGPVRSARSTDLHLVAPLRRPLFAYAGANAKFQELVNKAPIVDVGVDKASARYHRQKGRPAPYNLFTSTDKLFALAPEGAQPPPPLFTYRAAGSPLQAEGATAAGSLHIEFPGKNVTTRVDYTWDAASGTWRRTQDGTPHVDADGVQVGPRNVVVQFVEYRDTGLRDQSGSVVPEGELVGKGDAWILSDGKVVKGTWSKPTADAVTVYAGPDGKPVPLAPGQTWLELPPPNTSRVS